MYGINNKFGSTHSVLVHGSLAVFCNFADFGMFTQVFGFP